MVNFAHLFTGKTFGEFDGANVHQVSLQSCFTGKSTHENLNNLLF